MRADEGPQEARGGVGGRRGCGWQGWRVERRRRRCRAQRRAVGGEGTPGGGAEKCGRGWPLAVEEEKAGNAGLTFPRRMP